MSEDLDRQLAEMGPEFRGLVERVRHAYQPVDAVSAELKRAHRAALFKWTFGYLAAASLMILVGLGVIFRDRADSAPRTYTVRLADAAREYTLAVVRNDEAVKEMLSTQRADGGWANDFLTRRNAEALRTNTAPAAQLAYKKAMRNLRSKGLL